MGGVIVVVLIAIVGISACRVVPERRRLVVLRAGRPVRVAGPGVVWLVPVVERGVSLDLDEAVPGWRALDGETLARQIEATLARRP